MRSLRQLTLSTRVIALTAMVVIVGNLVAWWWANRQLTAIVDAQQSVTYANKIGDIITFLEAKGERLRLTGAPETYREDFQASALQALRKQYYHENASVYPFISDVKGDVVLHPVLKRGDSSLRDRSFMQTVIAKRNGELNYIYTDGEPKWCVFRDLPEWGWVVGYAMPVKVKYAAANQLRSRLIIVLVAMLLVILVLLGIVIRHSMKPVAQLTIAAGNIARGALDTPINTTAAGEIGDLALSFSAMRDAIRQKINELKEYQEGLEDLVAERTKQLEGAQRELLDNAHRAGMADIAIGVLHNIGNILNSLNTTIECLERRMRAHHWQTMDRTTELVAGSIDDLDALLASGQREKLFRLLIALGESFSAQRKEIVSDLARLTERINAIENVISSQQQYAGMTDFDEDVRLDELVRDSLTINARLFEREQIDVVSDIEVVPAICAQRSKLLQVLGDLFKNAADAMRSAGPATRQLHLSVRNEEGCVQVVVRDSGDGISQDKLDVVFSQGFTTRVAGLGLGLHRVANWAAEMGGAVRAESDGAGKGASLILTFPVATARMEEVT